MKAMAGKNNSEIKKPGFREKRDSSTTGRMIMMRNNRMSFPNMLLIAGDGRNVGKTSFAVQVIRKLSAKADVVGVKTTPHRHIATGGLEILVETGEYMVALEHGEHDKDSALFRRAGAKEVFLVMAAQQYLGRAFSHISGRIQNKLCVAESGGLVEYIRPAVFFFIKKQGEEIRKRRYMEFDPVVVTNRDMTFDFAMENLDVKENGLVITE